MSDSIFFEAKGTEWGWGLLWVVLIVGLLFVGSFLFVLPPLLRWYFIFSGLVGYPSCMIGAIKKDDYPDVVLHTNTTILFHTFISIGFLLAAFFVDSTPVLLSIAVIVVMIMFPYKFNKFLLKENVFKQLRILKVSENDKFINENEIIVGSRPYLFFYDSVMNGKFELAATIFSKFKLSLSQKILMPGLGVGEPETVSNVFVANLYKEQAYRWESVLEFLKPMGLRIDSQSLELVKDLNTGIGWVDNFAKEDNPNRLAIRKYVKENRDFYDKKECSECSGSGRYFDHHDDDGDASCPYCGGRGFYEV